LGHPVEQLRDFGTEFTHWIRRYKCAWYRPTHTNTFHISLY